MMLIAFSLDDHAYALHLPAVERVVRIVEVTPLPDAPDIVVGVVNMRGEVIPVVDIRKRFALPERAPDLSDQLIVARTSRRAVALIADTVTGVIECDEADVIAAEAILPGMGYIQGVAKLKDGMLLIHDLDSFLSLEEDRLLHAALKDA
jgi:purine-binding chemotaxis protein CheW